jgi:hypothetical protein
MRFFSRRPEGERGQALVEATLVLPIVLLLVVSVAELGVVYGNVQSLVYGSREGARVGSALARGDPALCGPGQPDDPSGVDATLVAAVQRILQSPDSGVRLAQVEEIRIFKATDSGAEAGPVNVWHRNFGPTDVDPGAGTELIVFGPDPSRQSWPVCSRDNTGAFPDSIGVSVGYTYNFVMPVAALANAISGGRLQMPLKETTVMALNPSS